MDETYRSCAAKTTAHSMPSLRLQSSQNVCDRPGPSPLSPKVKARRQMEKHVHALKLGMHPFIHDCSNYR